MRHINGIIGLIIAVSLTACGGPGPDRGASVRTVLAAETTLVHVGPTVNEDGDAGTDRNIIRITAGSQTFSVTLGESEAAKAFTGSMPLTLNMSELGGNEKYYYLSEPLPTAAEPVGMIKSGDLMLYGSDCLVLFYEDFSTSYRYTRLGAVTDPTGLREALGSGSVEVRFEWESEPSMKEVEDVR